MGLVPGVVALNAVLAAVGFCVLYPALRGRSALTYASYAGVALLLGAGLVPLVLSMLAPTGLHLGLPAFGFLGYFVASLFGIWLIISIWRSGRKGDDA